VSTLHGARFAPPAHWLRKQTGQHRASSADRRWSRTDSQVPRPRARPRRRRKRCYRFRSPPASRPRLGIGEAVACSPLAKPLLYAAEPQRPPRALRTAWPTQPRADLVSKCAAPTRAVRPTIVHRTISRALGCRCPQGKIRWLSASTSKARHSAIAGGCLPRRLLRSNLARNDVISATPPVVSGRRGRLRSLTFRS